MNNYYKIFFLFLCTLCIISCDTDEVTMAGPFAEEYSPIEVGKFLEYAVDTTFFDNDGESITSTSSFVREQIINKIDSIGQSPVFIIERAWKNEPNAEYKAIELWKVRFDKGDLIRTERNLEFLSIESPIVKDQIWDGVLFDKMTIVEFQGETLEMFKAWEFKVLDINIAEQVGTFEFDDLLIVQQADDENHIERRFSVEKYQKNLGLVHKEQIILDTQCVQECEGQTWMEKAHEGIIMEMTLVNHN